MSASATTRDPVNIFENALWQFRAQAESDPMVPAWLVKRQKQGWERYLTLGLPSHRWEPWKYVDLRPVLNTPFQPATRFVVPARATKEVEAASIDPQAPFRLVFMNGQFAPEWSRLEAYGRLPNGAFVGRIRDGLISHGEVLEKSLASRIKASDDPFEALNTANLSDGALIYVPAGKAIESLIEIIFLTDGSELEAQVLSHPRWLVVAESGAVVRLAVQFIGVPDQEMYLNNAVYEIQAGENANIQQTILIQEYDDKGMTLLKGKATLAAGSQVSMFALTLGGAMVRHCLEADLEGENADCTMNGLSIVRNSRHVHNHPTVRHQAGNASSRQLFKAILNEQAQSEFDGTIVVAKDANGTNAQQLSRNLVLSGEAQVFTRPWLQIDADDVKCSHGATVGQLEENELFYLASRGIDANSARALLTYGFAEDMLTDVSPKPLRENLERRLLAVLGQTPVQ